MEKCIATGKSVFASLEEARLMVLRFRWGFKIHRDLFGKRIKHRTGRPIQCRAYYCHQCGGYHITKCNKRHFIRYEKMYLQLIS